MDEDLFGNSTKDKKVEIPKSYVGVYDPYEVVSALVKEIRLGNVEDALYWFTVMVQGKAGLQYIARRLMIESQESCLGAEPAIYASSVYNIVSVGGDHAQDALFQLVVYLCKAEKTFSSEEMRDYIKHWYKVDKDIIKIKKGESNQIKPIPRYALDVHTRRGSQMKKEGKEIDERFSGSEKGIYSMMTLYEKNGRIHKDDYLTKEEEYKMRKHLYE